MRTQGVKNAVGLVLILGLALSACKSEDYSEEDFDGEVENAPAVDSGSTSSTKKTQGSSGNGVSSSQPRNTSYCRVDSKGNILSSDRFVVESGKRQHGVGGGCVTRPIRDVWATMMNLDVMKDADIAEAKRTWRPDLTRPESGLYFAYDVQNTVNALGGAITVKWVMRWLHSVVNGTFEAPEKIAIGFQKIEGTTHITYDKEGIVLDLVTPNVTSFVMDQMIEADQVDATRVRKNLVNALEKARNGSPDWSSLPDHL